MQWVGSGNHVVWRHLRLRNNVTGLLLILNDSTYTHPFNGPFFGTTHGSAGTRKVKNNPDFTEARDSEWQWHQLGHMQVCTSLQTDNHASTLPLCFLQAGCPSCRPTNSVKALKALNDSNQTLTHYRTFTTKIRPFWWQIWVSQLPLSYLPIFSVLFFDWRCISLSCTISEILALISQNF